MRAEQCCLAMKPERLREYAGKPAGKRLSEGGVGTGPAPKRISGGPLSHGEAIEIKSNDEESL